MLEKLEFIRGKNHFWKTATRQQRQDRWYIRHHPIKETFQPGLHRDRKTFASNMPYFTSSGKTVWYTPVINFAVTGTTIQMINQKPLFHSTSAMSPPKDLVYKVAWREILLIFWTLKWHAKFTCRVQVLHYSGRQMVIRLVLVVFIFFFWTGCQDCPMTSKAEVWMLFKEVMITKLRNYLSVLCIIYI